MIERVTEPEFWIKWFTIGVFVLLAFMSFGSAFDRTRDINRDARTVLAAIGILSVGMATAIYRWM